MSYTPGIARIVSELHTTTSVVNTTSLSSVFSLTIPGGPIVAAGDRLRLTGMGDMLNNSGGAVSYTWGLVLGATSVWTSASVSMANGANRHPWWLDVEIACEAVAAQRVGGTLLQSASGAASANNFSSAGSLVGYGTAAEDLSTAKAVTFNVTMTVANASTDFRVHAAAIELIRKPV